MWGQGAFITNPKPRCVPHLLPSLTGRHSHALRAGQGETRMALYGLGNVRDERLGRLFQTPGCVQW